MINKVMAEFDERVPMRDIWLFLGFYYLSAVLFYTASWVSYGAFEGGHPPYFDVVEFFAASGFQFIVSFIVTIPIWYLIILKQKIKALPSILFFHISFLPIFVGLVYLLLAKVKNYFGWAFSWGGYSAVWTFYIIGLFYTVQFSLMHAYVYHKRHLREALEKSKWREAALQSQIVALKAQLNPHFLHNLFNSINASIPPENETTRELIVQLSDLFRYQNAASQQDLVPLREEIQFLENYLALSKVRLKERLQYTIEVSAKLLDHQIPPMLLQPLVENALTHGISPKVGVSALVIKILKNDQGLYFEVADTGRGIEGNTDFWHKGLGLSSTRQRLRQMFATELLVEANKPSGVKVSFTL